MNGIKSVGFNLQEGSDYDGMMDLMVGGRSQREILDSIPFYKENNWYRLRLNVWNDISKRSHGIQRKPDKKKKKERYQKPNLKKEGRR